MKKKNLFINEILLKGVCNTFNGFVRLRQQQNILPLILILQIEMFHSLIKYIHQY